MSRITTENAEVKISSIKIPPPTGVYATQNREITGLGNVTSKKNEKVETRKGKRESLINNLLTTLFETLQNVLGY